MHNTVGHTLVVNKSKGNLISLPTSAAASKDEDDVLQKINRPSISAPNFKKQGWQNEQLQHSNLLILFKIILSNSGKTEMRLKHFQEL